MSIKRDILLRIYMAFGMVFLIAVAILVQSFRIMVVQGDHWRNMADSMTTTYKTIAAERGNIFTEDGKLLATSLPYFEIRMDVNANALDDHTFYSQVDSLAICLSTHFKDKTKWAYKDKLINARKQGNRYLLIKRNVTFPELQEIKKWPMFRDGRYNGGLIIEQTNKRKLPYDMLAHRTLGYVREGPGSQSVGLEAQYDDILSGINGKRLMQKIAGGNWMPLNDENEIDPKNGSDIVSTIDISIQDVAESALYRALQTHNADHGSVIVMEVKTGKIRAIANLGKTGGGEYFEKYNYAIGEATEPGSTFKTASMIAMLENGLLNLEDSINIGYGEARFSGQLMRDSETHNLGKVTVRKAFEISSNVGISKLAHKFYSKNPQQLIDHLRKLQLDKPTGIEIHGEATPVLRGPGDPGWSAVSVPWMSVGYEVSITPLQSLLLYNAIANDGKMMKPMLVSEIREYGHLVKHFKPQVIDPSICSDKTLKAIKELLLGAVEQGTAKRLKTVNYSFAGKTGTAKIADKKYGYNSQVYQASFAGYFPADEPLYSCIVVINAPSNGIYYGSSVAGPVFREIADKIYAGNTQMHLPINNTDSLTAEHFKKSSSGYAQDFAGIFESLEIENQIPEDADWIKTVPDKDKVEISAVKINNSLVPSVRGMGLRDAIYLLENVGMEVVVTGRGKVTYQSITPGTQVRKGARIMLELN